MSVTIRGLIATVLAIVFTPDESNVLLNFVDSAILVAGILTTYYGRWRQGDMTWWGGKK